ncbi:hypothetical protein [Furfurilactobacillus entadae]|uniref:hypothetical protein n=1 Tax=Furfurilactobacillus entadae TaxID=2922307 RepID=UPI0035EB49AD
MKKDLSKLFETDEVLNEESLKSINGGLVGPGGVSGYWQSGEGGYELGCLSCGAIFSAIKHKHETCCDDFG